MIFFFEDNILDNDRRKSFYKLFLAKNNRKDTDYQFLSNHIYELDNYIKIEIQSQYDALVRAFPLGIQELHSSKPYGESDLDFKERIINDKETVERLDKVKRTFDELKRKYPVGLPAFQKFNSFDDGKNSAELSLEEVIEHEDEIAKFERYADEHSKFLNWQREQKEFASISRNLCPENYGCYFYDVPLSGINADGSATTSEYRVWQHFYTSFYDTIPGTTISDDFAYLSKRAAENSKFLNGGWNYKDSVYDDILGLIKAFKDKVGDISIVFASNGLDSTESFVFNHSKFEYLISKLDESDILYYEGDADLFQDDKELTKHILIFEFVSTNSRLIQTVEQIRKQFTSRQPLISYISLRKGYDSLEIEQLATQKEQERKAQKAKEEAEKKRLQEEKERKQREEETKRKERQRKRQEIQELHACVQDWHLTRYGIRYNYIYEYLKTTAPRNATESEWDIRHLIWAFKNDPNKSDRDYSYSEALDIIVPRYESVLKRTFSANTSKLTFACLPASTSNKNRLRWYEFSKRVCADLNMINAYEHIRITADAIPKHLGGEGNAQLSFDEGFFKDKYVVICDDIKTSGKSLAHFKSLLENMDAIVICAFTIGQTIHE